jgi:2,3-bisphosphoglycerate-dependent phosphoglycerate mutase
MTMHSITLLRHGESEGNHSGILQGQADYPLTELGIEQAKSLARDWKDNGITFDRIISSPLKRAMQTAEIISDSLKAPIEFEPAWMERDFGRLQGIELTEIAQRMPPVDYFHPYEPIGGSGESQVDLYLRASSAIQKLIRLPEGSYLVVSHGGILNKALFVVIGITPQGHYHSPIFHFGNAGYAQLRYNSSSRQWAVICLNSHFPASHSEAEELWSHD